MAEKLPLLDVSHRAFLPVDAQTQNILQEPRHRPQHPLPRRLGLHIDVAVVGIAAEAVATPFQFLVQIVQQQIRQDR
jgi:hypothetical protein